MGKYVLKRLTQLVPVLFLVSIIDGYLIVVVITWIQQRIPGERLGRVMSVIMLASQGLFPISAAVAGVVAGWNLQIMLIGSGLVMLAVAAVGFASRTIRRMGFP